MLVIYLVVALVAGALVIVQTGANTRLKEAFGETLPAVVVSSLIGIVALGFELHEAGVARLLGCALLLAGLGLIWKF